MIYTPLKHHFKHKSMTEANARKILIQLNKWRRDNHTPPRRKMPDPKEVGIDVAIEKLKPTKK